MKNILRLLSLYLFFAILMASCDMGLKGDFKENQPPTTQLTVNEINLEDEDQRLVSQINITWWGDDPDGYVTGYELYIGELDGVTDDDWTFTESTDSTFILPIPEGQMDADVRFTVRAVDNEDARDPDPPSIVFPITNSPPEVEFKMFQTPPDTTYRIFSFGYVASDPDGDANLNRIEVALNDTTSEDSWKEIPLGIELVTIRVDDTLEEPIAALFTGRSAFETDFVFDEIHLNAENEFFIRAIDNAAAVSEVISHTWFLKQQQSNILFLNDYFGPNTEARGDLHLGLLNDIGITNVDYIDISDGQATGGRRVQLTSAFPDRSLAAPTINMMLAEWDHIYWISDNLDRNIGYALELTTQFFEEGGTMFVNIPTKFIPSDNVLLEFLPFENVATVGGETFRLESGDVVTAGQDMAAENVPYLEFRRNQQPAANPIIPFGGTVQLFEAPYKTRTAFGEVKEYDGAKLISATNPGETLLYFGIDISEFTQESELAELIELISKDILRFEP